MTTSASAQRLPFASLDARKGDRRALLPSAIFWAVALSAYFMIAYNGCNWLASRRLHVGTLYFAWERYIPFLPVAIYPYMSIDLFFFFSPLLCSDRAELRAHAKRILLAITGAGACFILYPLKMGITHPSVHGFEGKLFELLEGFDRPFNLVPSLHIALLCILWVIYSRHTRGVLRAIIQTWFILIVISTLLTFQHHVIDLVGGYALGLLCLFAFPDSSNALRAKPIRNPVAIRVYGFAAISFGLIAFLSRPWGIILFWPAVTFALLAVGYAFTGPTIFRKQDGRLPHSSRVIFGPYLAIARVVRLHYRRRSAPHCQIAPGVWLGREPSSRHWEELSAMGIGAILDLTAECSRPRGDPEAIYFNLPLLDLTPPTVEDLHQAVGFIASHTKEGVYIHCALGYSRAACVAAAYLLQCKKARSAEEAIAQVRAVRPAVVIKPHTLEVLQDYHASFQRPTASR